MAGHMPRDIHTHTHTNKNNHKKKIVTLTTAADASIVQGEDTHTHTHTHSSSSDEEEEEEDLSGIESDGALTKTGRKSLALHHLTDLIEENRALRETIEALQDSHTQTGGFVWCVSVCVCL